MKEEKGTKKPYYKQWWFIAIAVIVALLVLSSPELSMFLGICTFVGGIVLFIVFTHEKRPKKLPTIITVVGFVIIFFVSPPPSNTSEVAEDSKVDDEISDEISSDEDIAEEPEEVEDIPDVEPVSLEANDETPEEPEDAVEESPEESSEPAKPDKSDSIRRDVENIIQADYDGTIIREVVVNEDLGTDEEGKYIVLAHLTFDRKNGKSMTRDMTRMYSGDLAARMADTSEVNEVTVFWEAPFHSSGGNVAKFNFQGDDQGMYIVDEWYDPILNE